MTKETELPPLSPMGQLLYDIIGIMEDGMRSMTPEQREALDKRAEERGSSSQEPARVRCSFEGDTLTVTEIEREK
jgi:hypothetical protein